MSSIDTIAPDGRRLPAGSKAPKGARYRVRYRTPDGRSRTKTFSRKVDAEQFAASAEHTKATGTYVDTSAGRVKFRYVAEAWASAQPHRATTAQSVRTILDVHVLPVFGHRPIASILPSEVQAWVSGLELAPSTVQIVYGKVAAIFGAAVLDRKINRSPCERINLPKPPSGEIEPMSAEQVRKMAEAAPAHYRALVVLLAGTGLRPAEGLGLCRSRVRWLERSIRVDQQLVTLAGETPMLAEPKTPWSVRTIAVPDEVLAVLGHHVEKFTPEASELLFLDDKGDPIRRNALGHAWRRAAEAAGVEGFTPHDLRHYAASVMIHRGASVKAVQRHLGHKSPKTTLDVYSHWWPDDAEVTRTTLATGLVGVLDTAEAARCVTAVSSPTEGEALHAV